MALGVSSEPAPRWLKTTGIVLLILWATFFLLGAAGELLGIPFLREITDLKRVSKPGRRVYARKDRLPRVLGGLGTAIMSTSSGIITHRQAAERGVGGAVIAFVW